MTADRTGAAPSCKHREISLDIPGDKAHTQIMNDPRNARKLVWHRTNMSDRVRCSECGEFVKWDNDGLFGTYVIGHAKIMHGVFPWDASYTDNQYHPKGR